MDRKEREWDASLCTLKWAGSFFIFLFFFSLVGGWERLGEKEKE